MSRDAIVVVGATGAVGREALAILADRGVPSSRVIAAASSAGRRVMYGDGELAVKALAAELFDAASLAIFAADAETARVMAPLAVERGCTVIDNSAAFRLHPRVPLVVPEVNGDSLRTEHRLIANPNCSAAILVTALEPLRAAFGVASITLATYQAVSGAGAAAIDELYTQCRGVLAGEPAAPSVFHEPCAFNVFSHDSPVDPETGLNGEEAKIIAEARRIWSLPDLPISPVCLRVPVVRSHTQVIDVTLAAAATEADIRSAIAAAPGVALIDDRAANRFPTPLKATGRDEVLVGRVRRDPSGDPRRWSLIVCGDQLRKGAALNAIQIAERLGKV